MRRYLGLGALLSAGSLAAQTPASWTLTEDLRIGSDAGPASFVRIAGIAPTKGGNIFILEEKVQEIRVFDAAGRFLRLAARRGRGPGEISNATGLAVDPAGNIWTTDPSNARFSVYSADGRFVRQVPNKPTAWSTPWGAVFDSAGNLLERYPLLRGNNLIMGYRRVHSNGIHVDTFAMPPCRGNGTREPPRPFVGMDADGRPMFYRTVPFQPQTRAVLDRRGTVWCTPGNDYVVYRGSLERQDSVAVIRSSISTSRVSPGERAAIIAELDSAFARYPKRDLDYSRIPATKPAINDLFLDDAGNVWIQRSTPAGKSTEFDVWNPQGRQIATARLPVRLKTDLLSPVVIGNSLYAVALDDDDVQSVIRARIRR